MKRIFSICTIILVFAGSFSHAMSPVPRQPGSSVWKISNSENTLFLGGSVHVLRDRDFPLPKEFDFAFSLSTALVLEADIEQTEDTHIAQYLMSRMLLPEDKTLRSVLDQDTYELLKSTCADYGIPLEVVSNFKPSMIMTTLSMLQIEKLGFVQQGVDLYYLNKAKEEDKPVSYLESMETQIDALVSMGDGYENDYIRYSLYDMENTEKDITVLLSEWKTGRPSKTEETLAEMKNQWPQIYKTMVTDRNTAWMPQIEAQLASGQIYCVIVGLAHLHGPDGLLRQLEDAGYHVEQLGY